MNALNVIPFPMQNPQQDFERFWSVFPRKISRLAAVRAWQSAIKKTTIQEILEAVDSYKKHKPDYADWCHPATWLNSERWTDQWEDSEPATKITLHEINKRIEAKLAMIDVLKTHRELSRDILNNWKPIGAIKPESRIKIEQLRLEIAALREQGAGV